MNKLHLTWTPMMFDVMSGWSLANMSFLCHHIICRAGPNWRIWGSAFCLASCWRRQNFILILIGRLKSSRSACSPAQPFGVNCCGNISPVECLLFFPLTDSQFTLRSNNCVLASSGHYISFCTFFFFSRALDSAVHHSSFTLCAARGGCFSGDV